MPQRLAMTSARYRLGLVLVLTAAVSLDRRFSLDRR